MIAADPTTEAAARVPPTPDRTGPLLEVQDLTIAFPLRDGAARTVVDRVSLRVSMGSVLAIVGESGSGKTMVARAILGLLPPRARVLGGRIEFEGQDLRLMSPKALRRVRGARIGMVFQEPLVSLNPALRIGFQVFEAMRLHAGLPPAEIRARAIRMLERLRIEQPEACLARYPHEFSGGMRQRILLASVLLPRPALLLADEPTTALDSIIQREALALMMEVTRELGTSVVLISHDLGLVGEHAQDVAVMKEGAVVESGRVGDILLAPRHPYTQALLDALPRRPARAQPAPAPGGAGTVRPLVSVRGLGVHFRTARPWPWGRRTLNQALDGVELEILRGGAVGVVGESGSGKTTLGRAILGLVAPSGGAVLYDGEDVRLASRARLRALRRRMQFVFQDPYSSLDPRMRVGEIVGEGLRHRADLGPGERRARVDAMLEEVSLGRGYHARYPHELSGGERQRVCIARAMVMEPEFVVADEPVASLDVTIQAQILRLLKELRARHRFTCLFISHNLAVVEQVADFVVVMLRGRVVEQGPREAIFDEPAHPYTRRLLAAVTELRPSPAGGFALARREPALRPPPPGWLYDDPGPETAPGARPPTRMIEVAERHLVACRERAGEVERGVDA
jgi:peptide/nickel transport system ATP-binding protein